MKQKEIRYFIQCDRLCLIGVLETKVPLEFMGQTLAHCFPSCWKAVHNRGSDKVARIIVAWDPQVMVVDVVHATSQMITVKVDVDR